MHLTTYLTLLSGAEVNLAASYRQVAGGHHADADVHYTCQAFARQCEAHASALAPISDRYASRPEPEPERLHPDGLTSVRSGPIGLLRDLQDLYQLATLVDITWTLVGQAAHGARDPDLVELASRSGSDTAGQLAWLRTRMKADAPQTLLVTPLPTSTAEGAEPA